MSERENILETRGLKKYFSVGGRSLKAVDNVAVTIRRGETLGLVGESGCGKTTFGRTILRLYNPTGGQVLFKGRDITGLSAEEMRGCRKEMQIIFQDPYASLDPRMMVWEIIAEGMLRHFPIGKKEARERAEGFIRRVGLLPEHATRFPHEFSGGQRQRIGIARALAVEPDFIVCDEPISALDVSIQAQIVNMLQDLQEEMGLTYLFIAHDISMVKYISDRIGVMYLGQLVETGESDDVFTAPIHPYTKALCSAVPIPDPDLSEQRRRIILQGDVPSPLNAPPGCHFSGRCPQASDRCKKEVPQLTDQGNGHSVACFHI